MKLTMKLRILTLITALLGVAHIPAIHAQDFPKQPIKLVVPWAPGGNVDITARAVAPSMSEILGQQVIVENKPGAGGFIGSTGVVKSTPDGYTLLLGSSGSVSVAPALVAAPPYNPVKDLTVIGPIHAVPIVLSATAKGNMKTFADFAAKAKAGKEQISVGSAGNGSSQHLALEMLALRMGVKLNHIPYKGSGPALVDQLTASISHIKSGAIIPLAQTGKTRSPLLPNVPTFEELGIKDFDMVTYTGIFGPAGMPPAVIEKLSAALQKTLAQESVKERFNGLGVDIITLDRSAFAAYVKKDFEDNQAIAKAANIVMQ